MYGLGHGAWTKAIAHLQPKQIFALDVVAPEYAGFWEYVGQRSNVSHVVATDFSLSAIPDMSLDYFFSFGCFCHLKPDMCIAYINSLAARMKPEAHGLEQESTDAGAWFHFGVDRACESLCSAGFKIIESDM